MNKMGKIATIFLGVGLLFIITGVSYSFFVYNKEGLYTQAINGGKIDVLFTEASGNNISLDNAYPLTDKEALTKALSFDFSISGYNESKKNAYYAIELEYGDNIEALTRFYDTDMKLSLYENSNQVINSEIFTNLNKKSIYYGYIEKGTIKTTPTVNNYTIRLWINDNVVITDTPENIDLTGKSVYVTNEFEQKYANFKVNVIANVTVEEIGEIFYDANGGNYTPKPTSLLTNKITLQKPVKDGKAFLGWSEDKNATVPTYKSGDHYGGGAKLLYAVYGDTRNVMGTFPSTITSQKDKIVEIYFIDDTGSNITARYGASAIKADLTYDGQGSVKCWVEANKKDNTKYNLYIGSSGTTYLNTGNGLLYLFGNAQIIDLANVDSSMVTSMNCMIGHSYYDSSAKTYVFDGCINLTSIDVSGLNTSSVLDMQSMFAGCVKLTNLDVSNFDTSKVTDMSRMFQGEFLLQTLDLNNFDTSNVTNMSYMFYRCENITSLDLSNFDTSNVTNMADMFCRCLILTSIDVSNFNTSNVANMSYMFYRCLILTSIDVSNFDTSNVINISCMFHSCEILTSIDVSNFNTSNVTSMSYMFYRCENITSLDLSNFDTSNVTNVADMFRECISLKKLDISSFTFNTTITESAGDAYFETFRKLRDDVLVTVKSATEQAWILSLDGNNRPSAWSTTNVVVKTV